MKKDLYSQVGVPKSASKSDIKRAYRRKAKQHHPDKNPNGSVVKWHAVQQAYETLSDDGSRARYDETGEISGNANLLRDKAIAELCRMFVILAEQLDTKHCNLVDLVTQSATGAKRELDESTLKAKAKAKKFRDAAERFTANDGADNFPAAVMNSQADAFDRQAAGLHDQVAVDEALRILKEFKYRTDKGGSVQPFTGGSIFFTITQPM